ncbi:MAG TPA: hypothetical protein VGN20_25125 [Mucilaginibacter sp.]|jgi:hypothetical protein
MNWQDNINTIKEIFPGQYQIILDFASNDFVKYLISDNVKYVWVHNHWVGNFYEWQKYDLPISGNKKSVNVLARQLSYDFILPTSEFKELMPFINNGITLTQINHIPKHYLDPKRIQGKTWYELLSKECDYLFEVKIPSPTDYGELLSPDKGFLQALLDNKEIDWNNLP